MQKRDMAIEIAAFAWVPEMAQGYVRDLRLRWALKEAGLPYTVRHLAPGENADAEYRAWQPFGQVPAYRDREVTMFESGACLMRISGLSETLRGFDPAAEAQINAWAFAALNSVEPASLALWLTDMTLGDDQAGQPLRDKLTDMLDGRLKGIAAWLEDRDWLADRFSVADIAMATTLREVEDREVFRRDAAVVAYLERCLARPAFAEALEEQLAGFRSFKAA